MLQANISVYTYVFLCVTGFWLYCVEINCLSRKMSESPNKKVEIGKLSYCICDDCLFGRGSYGIVFRGTFINEVATADEDKVMDVAVKRVDRFRNKIEEEILRLVNGHPKILR